MQKIKGILKYSFFIKYPLYMDNSTFEEVMVYCKKYKDAEVDKWHLDFYDADWNKIKDIF